MINVTNLDKYFNKNKSNQIHVINNTSLTFPLKGLVAITGPSGCGKTTLLNVISGLDSASGKIKFDNFEMDRYKSRTWDKIRANNIGFIFQNFYLLEDRTVYDNIKLTLNMIGISDDEEVDYRINYCLEAVGLSRFKKRLASDLSIGQKQRVGIARAIAKNPDVIIADEPTGNLDTKNSVEIMNVIKKISEEKLVVLVTHNLSLANNYANRIIEIEDGSVKADKLNDFSILDDLSYDNNVIYLGDLDKEELSEDITTYSKEGNKVNLTIIRVNNQIYLKTNDPNVKLNVIEPKSSIKFVNAKKETVKEDKYETSFTLEDLEKENKQRIRKSSLSFRKAFIEALKRIVNAGRKARVQIVSLILLGIMFSVGIHVLFSNLIVDDSNIYIDPNLYATEYNNDYSYLSDNFIKYDYSFYLNARFVTGRKENSINIDYHLPIDGLKESDIVLGRLPENQYEIVIDGSVLDEKYQNHLQYKVNGIYEQKHLIGEVIKFVNWEFDTKTPKEFKIVGVVNKNTKAIYLDKNVITDLKLVSTIYVGFGENDLFVEDIYYRKYSDDVVLLSGRAPKYDRNQPREVIFPKHLYDELNNKIVSGSTETGIDQLEMSYYMNVVGTYESSSLEYFVYISEEDYKSILEQYPARTTYYYSIDGTKPVGEDFYNVRESAISQRNEFIRDSRIGSISQMLVSLGFSSLIFFFLVRSSLTSRIKEISIYRALGVDKNEVRISFALEYFIITLMTSFIGVIIGTYIIRSISNSFFSTLFTMRATPLSFGVASIGIIVSNVLIALIPVSTLLRKKPANLLSNFDI